MVRVTSPWNKKNKPTPSVEPFPAHTAKAAESLEKVIDDLASMRPDFVFVTFEASGSTKDGSHQLKKKLAQNKGLEVWRPTSPVRAWGRITSPASFWRFLPATDGRWI